ncbi:uncharacterized protein DUF397 [Herbihabitans rhizosphaerae]|uniref:Uncharacterized protein DUF397 n=1 Tax=Herbihabitans rhizosphaerae TaxID=1872711 RepID=A0A4Q7KTN7_9PSEU|nr:DUF397 domain-containing protein [Herbihabitans rhizosphaerae]RZS39191.1 uncharacterized protein DUF397 [Herbihabitans rhizosphaerae]
MRARDLPGASWRKSSRSGGGEQCVELAHSAGGAVRDSKNPDGPVLAAVDLAGLISAAKRGAAAV